MLEIPKDKTIESTLEFLLLPVINTVLTLDTCEYLFYHTKNTAYTFPPLLTDQMKVLIWRKYPF